MSIGGPHEVLPPHGVTGAGMGTCTLVGGRASSRGGDLRWVMHLASVTQHDRLTEVDTQ